MSNDKIVNVIQSALENKNDLIEKADKVRQRYTNAKLDIKNYNEKLNEIFKEVVK